MQDRGGMLQFPVLADDGAFAVALGVLGPDAQGRDAAAAQKFAQFRANGHQRLQVLGELARERIGDNSDRQRLSGRRRDGGALNAVGLLDEDDQFPDLGRHRPISPQSATTAGTARYRRRSVPAIGVTVYPGCDLAAAAWRLHSGRDT